MTCPRCNPEPRQMDAASAFELYQKLKPFLVSIQSAGCHLPCQYLPGYPKDKYGRHKTTRGDSCSDWPLHHWDGPGRCPVVAKWSAKQEGRGRLSFKGFCKVYGIEPVES